MSGKVVGGNAVAHDDQIVQFLIGDRDAAVDGVVPGYFAVVGIAEADHGLDAFRNRLADAVFGAPAAVVARFDAGGALRLAHGVELFGRGIALVGQPFGHEFINNFAIAFKTIHLVDGTFVVVEVEPLHRVENDLGGFIRGALLVGVFNAKQEFAAEVTGHGPAADSGAGGAQMHHARGRRSDAGTNFFHFAFVFMSHCACGADSADHPARAMCLATIAGLGKHDILTEPSEACLTICRAWPDLRSPGLPHEKAARPGAGR